MEISNALKYINLAGVVTGLVALRGPMHLRASVREKRGNGDGPDSYAPSDTLRYVNLTGLRCPTGPFPVQSPEGGDKTWLSPEEMSFQ